MNRARLKGQVRMAHSPDLGKSDAPTPAPLPLLHLRFSADAEAVRAALQSVATSLAEAGVDLIDQATVELVLAEVLNNVTEHAYGAAMPGGVGLILALSGPALSCQVTDTGRRLPGGRPPPASRRSPDPDALPEGGFGWPLIHALTRRLGYRHQGGENVLSFEIPLTGWRDTPVG